MKSRLAPILIALAAFAISPPASARKQKLRLNTPKTQTEDYAAGSFCVSSDCKDCHDGYSLDQVVYSGYDKPLTSDKETLFITNNTDRELTAISFYIKYFDANDRQIHKAFHSLDVSIPPGETRMVSFRSWDVQNSFRYKNSRDSRRDSYTYTIELDPVSIYLKF